MMTHYRIITPNDVMALLDKIRCEFDSTMPVQSVYEKNIITSQQEVADDAFECSQQSQEESQIQMWEVEEESGDLLAIVKPPPTLTPSKPIPPKLSSFERYLKPAFKQADKYLKLSQILRVLQSIQESQIQGVVRQIRRIYYEDKELFQTQNCVVDIVRCLEDHWNVPSSSFNLMPAYKGMFAGPIGYIARQAQREGGAYVDNSSIIPTWGVQWLSEDEFLYKQELILDPSQLVCLKFKQEISWVLVVEKETVFSERIQELDRQMSHLRRQGVGVVVTGKGMPDFATRRMLEMMAGTLPTSVPFYALVDGDAYGMQIYHTYCSSIRHYTGPAQQMAHRLQWIGLKPSDSLSILQKHSKNGQKNMNGSGVVPLDLNEHSVAFSLASNETVRDTLQMEALRLIMYGYKLELEAISDQPLNSLLPMPVD